MKKLLFFPAAVCLALASGCFGDGGGGSGEPYALVAGDYLTSGGAVLLDECQFGFTGADFDGDLLVVSTGDGTVIVDGEIFPRSGNSFGMTDLRPAEPVNATCTVDLALVYSATIVATNAFLVSQRVDVSNAVGSGCGGLPVPVPCRSQISYRADLQ